MVEDLEQTPEGRLHRNRHGPIPRATDREISCPSAGKSESAYREVGMSASTGDFMGVSGREGGKCPLTCEDTDC